MFKIIDKHQLAPQIFRMRVLAPEVAKAAKPGQFVIVIGDTKGERIPLTICDYNTTAGTVSVVIQAIGRSTRKLVAFEPGETYHDFVGPLGRESEFIHEPLEKLTSKRFLFIAGGVGAAPVYPQIKWLKSQGIEADAILGARSQAFVIMKEPFKKVTKNLYITTDDGSAGFHGNVTQQLEHLVKNQGKHYDEVITIGPMIMMKFVSAMTKKLGIPTMASLNSMMIDGTGMCGACRVSVGGQTKFTCVDGPEFDAHEVDFEEAMRRQQAFKKEEQEEKKHEPHTCRLDTAVNTEKMEAKDRFTRIPVRNQDPVERSHNFEEVCLGYDEEEAVAEAMRCLECKNPACVAGCPVSIDIPRFVRAIKQREFAKAADIIAEQSALPAVCGRVCPQESQCEGKCVLGRKGDAIAIGKLERFVADWAKAQNYLPANEAQPNEKKVAVIGSGPAGLTCAGDLARMGYSVTIFEALQTPGGVLEYGIPEFRLPKEEVVKYEIENLKKIGVKIITNYVIGKTNTVDDLLDNKGYEAVFIGSGAGLPKFMHIPGENLNGVFSANEFLTRNNLMKAYREDYDTPISRAKRVAVVGGGNVAMDAARTALRLGSEVVVIYRRSEEELPARAEEVEHAKEEGVEFLTLANPLEVVGDKDGWVRDVKCIRMELGEADDSGRRRPQPMPGSEFYVSVDAVIMSLGTNPNPLIYSTTKNLKTNKGQCIEASEETGATSREGVFAGGDAVTGAATVILAMGAGKKAAKAIDHYITQKQTVSAV